MLQKIFCIPNNDLAQKIDLNTIRNEVKQDLAASKIAVEAMTIDYDSDNEKRKKPKLFKVLPLLGQSNAFLKRQLSLKHNKYLACKFDQFLNDQPKECMQVVLYRDIGNNQNQPKPRRMKLNGKFYDVDLKLAPTPYIPDPRQYGKKSSFKK